MAYNVQIDAEFMPMRENEEFVLRRNGVEFHVHVHGLGEFKGHGHIILTTRRLVYVNRDQMMPAFRSFSLPYLGTHDERMDMGMMGRFHCEGKCHPHMGLIPHQAHFKFWLNQGGILQFQHIYKHLLIRAKENRACADMMMEMRGPAFMGQLNGMGDLGGETTLYINVQRTEVIQPPIDQMANMRVTEEVKVQTTVQVNPMMNPAGAMCDALALDCALDGEFMPVRDMNEEFILRRNFIEFHVHVNGRGDFRGKGHLVLTTKRLVLVNREDPAWRSFSLPNVHVFNERFELGMMGRFHIDGHCRNDAGLLPHPAHFKVWFNQGGADRFQHIYKHVLFRSKERRDMAAIMIELRAPEFNNRMMGFPACQEETLLYVQASPAPMVAPVQVQAQVEVVKPAPVIVQPAPVMQQVQMTEALMLDCSLNAEFMPIKDRNEEFLVRRNFIEFHVHIRGRGDFRGHGHLILTTKRLVLVNRDPAMTMWKSFSFPNVHVFNERFELGMMGRFHIDAHCRNDAGLLPHPAHYKIWFKQGGADRFQHLYKHVLIRSKERRDMAAIMLELRDPMFNNRMMGFPACQEETLLYSVNVQTGPVQTQVTVQAQARPATGGGLLGRMAAKQAAKAEARAVVNNAPVAATAVAATAATAVAVQECVLMRDCALDARMMPIKEGNEEFVMRRNGVEFHIHIKGVGDFKAHGHAILTTKRLVLVNRQPSVFKSFQLPYLLTSQEHFKMGLMGRFHCEAWVQNNRSMFGHPAHYKIWLNQGGAAIFQHVYKHLLVRAKEKRAMNEIMMEMRGAAFQQQIRGFGNCGETEMFIMAGPAPVQQQPMIQQPMQQQQPVYQPQQPMQQQPVYTPQQPMQQQYPPQQQQYQQQQYQQQQYQQYPPQQQQYQQYPPQQQQYGQPQQQQYQQYPPQQQQYQQQPMQQQQQQYQQYPPQQQQYQQYPPPQ